MFKKLLLVSLLLFSCSLSHAEPIELKPVGLKSIVDNFIVMDTNSQFTKLKDTQWANLPSGLTFLKDFSLGSVNLSLDSDFSIGSKFATFTASRGATTPATYIDSAGVVQLVTTSDIPRYAGGYYDETGFHSAKGLMVEAAGTNLLIRTDGTAVGATAWTGWTVGTGTLASAPTQSVVSDTLYNVSGFKAQRIQYTGVAADVSETSSALLDSTSSGVASVVAGNVVTLSFYLKGSITGASIKLSISWRDNTDTLISNSEGSALTINSGWSKYSVTATAPATTDRVRARLSLSAVDDGDEIDIYASCPQIEINPYPTSFIPTTTAALTRNAETLKYAIAGNRTAAQETIFIKFMPLGGSFASDGAARTLINNDAPSRVVRKNTTATVCNILPNLTDNSTVTKANTTTALVNTSYVFCGTVVQSPSSYASYLNGVQEGTTGSTAWTLNDWSSSTYFYLGVNALGSSQFNGLIQKVAIFNRALSATEVSSVTSLLNN